MICTCIIYITNNCLMMCTYTKLYYMGFQWCTLISILGRDATDGEQVPGHTICESLFSMLGGASGVFKSSVGVWLYLKRESES